MDESTPRAEGIGAQLKNVKPWQWAIVGGIGIAVVGYILKKRLSSGSSGNVTLTPNPSGNPIVVSPGSGGSGGGVYVPPANPTPPGTPTPPANPTPPTDGGGSGGSGSPTNDFYGTYQYNPPWASQNGQISLGNGYNELIQNGIPYTIPPGETLMLNGQHSNGTPNGIIPGPSTPAVASANGIDLPGLYNPGTQYAGFAFNPSGQAQQISSPYDATSSNGQSGIGTIVQHPGIPQHDPNNGV